MASRQEATMSGREEDEVGAPLAVGPEDSARRRVPRAKSKEKDKGEGV